MMTPFLRAAQRGNLGEVQRLLREDPARIEESDHYGDTALLWAACNGHLALVQCVGGVGVRHALGVKIKNIYFTLYLNKIKHTTCYGQSELFFMNFFCTVGHFYFGFAVLS